ncbi:MAG: RcpC/CpaB family pilus assembly protein, partial [Pirellulales bacterium]
KSKIILQNIRVFAVDQTVQRSPDGAEERTIAKTVSLMLTPEQASKLSLAEQNGEVSLTPRNPDDEAAADWSEYTIDDLLSDGDKGSREKEQGRDDDEGPEQPNSAGLLSAIRAAVPAVPPFRMEIVEAQDVREMLFDAATGKPIREPAPNSSVPGPSVTPSTSPRAPAGDSPGDSDKILEDFPIDFNARR